MIIEGAVIGYLIIGVIWFAVLQFQGRVEGDWHEFTIHGLVWPLDLAAWVEQRLMKKG